MPKMKIKSHSQTVTTPSENNMSTQTMSRTFKNPSPFSFLLTLIVQPQLFLQVRRIYSSYLRLTHWACSHHNAWGYLGISNLCLQLERMGQ